MEWNLKAEVNRSVLDVNCVVCELKSLNKEIGEVEGVGVVGNGLYEEGDLVMDKLW